MAFRKQELENESVKLFHNQRRYWGCVPCTFTESALQLLNSVYEARDAKYFSCSVDMYAILSSQKHLLAVKIFKKRNRLINRFLKGESLEITEDMLQSYIDHHDEFCIQHGNGLLFYTHGSFRNILPL
jgi:hypothetical protein